MKDESRPKTPTTNRAAPVTIAKTKCDRLGSELVALFGRDVAEEAQGLDLGTVTAAQAKSVTVVAAQLQRFSGRPADQQAFVALLKRPVAALLCRWISDPDTAAGIVDARRQAKAAGTGRARRKLKKTVPETAPRTKPDGLVQREGGTMEVLTVKETAAVLKVTPRTVRALIDRGELKAKKIGRDWRVRREDLEAFLDTPDSAD